VLRFKDIACFVLF